MRKLLVVLITWMGACNPAPETVSHQTSGRLVTFEDSAAGFLWGYKDEAGSVVITPRFVVAGEFSEHGLAAVADSTGWHYINTSGATVVRPFVVDNGPDPFQEGLARFVDEGRVGYFDETGTIIVPAQFDYATPFAEGRATYCEGCTPQQDGEHIRYEGGRWGFLHHVGNAIVPAPFEEPIPGDSANHSPDETLPAP